MGQNIESRGHTSIIVLIIVLRWLLWVSVPGRDDNRVIGELSARNEPPNAFLDRFRWLEPLQENILKDGQHCCHSTLSELLQSGRDTWPKFFGYVEILHSSKWK